MTRLRTLVLKAREVNIEVVPFKTGTSDKPWLLVIFDETTKGSRPARLPQILGKTAKQRELSELRRELTASKESLQCSVSLAISFHQHASTSYRALFDRNSTNGTLAIDRSSCRAPAHRSCHWRYPLPRDHLRSPLAL